MAEYSDRRLGFRAAESPAFCPRRSAARKCRGQRRPGDRSRPWTGKADRSTRDFPSFRLRKEHYCRRWADTGSRAERVPAVQRVDPTALAQLGSRVLRQLRLKRQHSAFGGIQPQLSGLPCYGRAVGLFWAIENNAKIPLPRTTADNVSIQNVS